MADDFSGLDLAQKIRILASDSGDWMPYRPQGPPMLQALAQQQPAAQPAQPQPQINWLGHVARALFPEAFRPPQEAAQLAQMFREPPAEERMPYTPQGPMQDAGLPLAVRQSTTPAWAAPETPQTAPGLLPWAQPRVLPQSPQDRQEALDAIKDWSMTTVPRTLAAAALGEALGMPMPTTDIAAMAAPEALQNIAGFGQLGAMAGARIRNPAGKLVRGTVEAKQAPEGEEGGEEGGSQKQVYVPDPDEVKEYAAKNDVSEYTANRHLKWKNWNRAQAEQDYGPLVRSKPGDSKIVKLENTPEAVRARIDLANAKLDQPLEPWQPEDFGIFDRRLIQDALEGFPGVEQHEWPRDEPGRRQSAAHVDATYTDPQNVALIIRQIRRGMNQGGETFYASLYPLKYELMSRGYPGSVYDNWAWGTTPSSIRNPIFTEMAGGNMLYDMYRRGIPLTSENFQAAKTAYEKRWKTGLMMMETHRNATANVLEQGLIPPKVLAENSVDSYKVPTYGMQAAGDFAHSLVFDTHESRGQTMGSVHHPYFAEAGSLDGYEYGRAEQHFRDIARSLGIPTGMAQAARWFGGGSLTGLKSPAGDKLDMLEKQAAYTMWRKGLPTDPKSVRDYIINLVVNGGELAPWYRQEKIPDKRVRAVGSGQ